MFRGDNSAKIKSALQSLNRKTNTVVGKATQRHSSRCSCNQHCLPCRSPSGRDLADKCVILMLKGKGQEREQREEEEGGILPCFPMKRWWLCNTFSPSRGCGLQGGQSRLISFCCDSFYGSPPEGPAPFSYSGFLSLEELWVRHYVSTRETRGK